jgi:hypothetical protein
MLIQLAFSKGTEHVEKKETPQMAKFLFNA